MSGLPLVLYNTYSRCSLFRVMTSLTKRLAGCSTVCAAMMSI